MVQFLGKRQDSKVDMSYGTSLCTLKPFAMSMQKSSVEEAWRERRNVDDGMVYAAGKGGLGERLKDKCKVGTINDEAWNIKIGVVAERWPSLALCLVGRRVENIIILSGVDQPKSWRKVFEKWLGQRIEWMHINTDHVPSLKSVDLVMAQGSKMFVEAVLASYNGSQVCLLGLCQIRRGNIKSSSSTHWERIKHCDVGGVTTGAWWLGFPVV